MRSPIIKGFLAADPQISPDGKWLSGETDMPMSDSESGGTTRGEMIA